jgi:hypothetical protein
MLKRNAEVNQKGITHRVNDVVFDPSNMQVAVSFTTIIQDTGEYNVTVETVQFGDKKVAPPKRGPGRPKKNAA